MLNLPKLKSAAAAVLITIICFLLAPNPPTAAAATPPPTSAASATFPYEIPNDLSTDHRDGNGYTVNLDPDVRRTADSAPAGRIRITKLLQTVGETTRDLGGIALADVPAATAPANMRLAPELAALLRGKRIRATIWLKTTDITSGIDVYQHAGFVLNIFSPSQRILVNADTGDTDPASGTTDWKKYTIVADVPDNAAAITFKSTLLGTGTVWSDGLQIEIVGNDVATTDDHNWTLLSTPRGSYTAAVDQTASHDGHRVICISHNAAAQNLVRGWLGTGLGSINPKTAPSGYTGDSVALVRSVIPKSPAAGKLMPGDILMAVNDKPVTDVETVRDLIAGIAPDSKATIKVFRDGKEQDVEVVIGKLPDTIQTANGRIPFPNQTWTRYLQRNRSPEAMRGQTMHMTAWVKSDGPGARMLAETPSNENPDKDSMASINSRQWQQVSVTLRVPSQADIIESEFQVFGSSKLWIDMDSIQFEVPAPKDSEGQPRPNKQSRIPR